MKAARHIILLAVLSLVAFLLGRFFSPHRGPEPVKAPAQQKKVKPVSLSEKIVALKEVSRKRPEQKSNEVESLPPKMKFKQIHWDEQLLGARKKCQELASMELGDKELLDAQNPFYSDPQKVVAKLKKLFSWKEQLNYLPDYQNNLLTRLEKGQIDGALVMEQEGNLNHCQLDEVMKFVYTAIEAIPIHSWTKGELKYFLDELLRLLQAELETGHTVEIVGSVVLILEKLYVADYLSDPRSLETDADKATLFEHIDELLDGEMTPGKYRQHINIMIMLKNSAQDGLESSLLQVKNIY